MYYQLTRHLPCHPSDVVKPGCQYSMEQGFLRDQIVLIVHMLVSGIIKTLMLIAAFFIPFDQKRFIDSPPFAEPTEDDDISVKSDDESPPPGTVVELPPDVVAPPTLHIV